MFEPRRRKRENKFFNKKTIIGLLVAFVMISSLLAAWEGSSTALDKYNGYKFKANEYNIFGKIGEEWIEFNNHPSSLETIEVAEPAIQKLKDSKMIYLTFDPEDNAIKDIELARMKLSESLTTEFGIYSSVGASMNSTAYQAYPLIDCNNATQFIPVVYLKSNNETKINIENNCIFIYATEGFEFNPLLDRLRYGLYNVIK